ncbi:MAG: cation:proton antiporter [Oscillospiraceae bacterium]|nr:cation:proton antiporter [Oscillospiraceae bacterium]MBQ6403733.1 cation:proton antiporter [Oscillospiraceae bacterium]
MSLTTLSEHEIIATLIALALLLGSAFVVGSLMERVKAPRVVGEILGGLILGGTLLYHFFPELMGGIFMAYPEEGKVLNIFYQLGLIFLMFLSGYNTRLELDRSNGRVIFFVFFGATVLPMLGAIPFIRMFEPAFIGEMGNKISFGLVFTIGVAITSIPVISKIFFDMGIMNTRFSNTVLTVSTFQDLLLWILLNAATRIAAAGELRLVDMIGVVAITLGLFAVVKVISDHTRPREQHLKPITFYSVSFVILLLVCAGLYTVGINIMYAAFLVGYVVKAVAGVDTRIKNAMDSLGNFAFSFFIPIYFALVGIQLNLLHNFSFLRFAIFFVIAFGLEGIGTFLMLQFTDLRDAVKVNFAITMNARGGPGIVLATVAYSYQIISVEFFTVLILTTMLSSLIAGYWLRSQQKKDSTIFMRLRKGETD